MPLAYGLIEPADLSLPRLPERLAGLRIAHVTDLHVRRRKRLYTTLINQLTALRLDMVVFTGDYMTYEGDEPAATDVMRELVDRVRPRIGSFGVFGNHDTDAFRRAMLDLPIVWLDDQACRIDEEPIDLLGFHVAPRSGPDVVTLCHAMRDEFGDRSPGDTERVRIVLGHYPTLLPTASDLGADVMFAGHTHGGQIRLPGRNAIVNSSDLPLRYSCGIMRHRDTQLAVSRGIGAMGVQIRFLCPPHVPVYTLRRSGLPGNYTDDLEMINAW